MKKILVIISSLFILFILTAYIDASPTKGHLASPDETDTIYVVTDESPIYAIFDWDSGMNLVVGVIGEDEESLADYELVEGRAVELIGKGKFTLEIYTEEGSGNWECKFYNKKDWDKVK